MAPEVDYPYNPAGNTAMWTATAHRMLLVLAGALVAFGAALLRSGDRSGRGLSAQAAEPPCLRRRHRSFLPTASERTSS